MADRQGRIEIDAIINDSFQKALGGMSSSLRNVLDVTNSFAKAGVNNVNTAQALTKALTNATSASSLYSRATDGLARNQAVLGKYFRDTSVAAAQLERQLNSNTNATQSERKAVEQLISSLKAQSNARKDIMKFSAQADLRRQSDALNQLSSRYSMAGTRMSMALTLPIASFMRSSFANYRRLETETIRTTKLISDSYTRAADVAGIAGAKLSKDQLSYTREMNGTIRTLLTLEGAQKRMGEELDQVSTKYGIARELVQGLAGDFAELGIEEVDVLAGLVDLTAGVEKLGNLDIGASQEFIKSIFQTILRIKRDTGTLERTADGFIDYSNAVAETTQQLALFNLIENKTQMSLKDIAKGFPEVTAAATSFGLTMTEATALVVPMVSAGMQVGASANSVKVSLQRVVDLTKENSKMITSLKESYKEFNTEAGVGIGTVQKLADSYNSMKRGALAEQGTLEFFSRLFGVRQGPRMEVAIQNLAQFQENLTKGLQALDKDDTSAETIEGILARKLEQAVQQQAKAQGLGEKFTSFTIKKFEDLGNVVRLSQSKDAETAKAFSNARNQLAVYVKDEAKKGNDLISKISTESGKALFIGAIGNVEGQRKFQQEVEASLKSVEVRYQRGRELIKSIGRQLVPVLAEILSAVLPVLQKINDVFTKIPSWVKYVVSFGLIMLATVGPILKLAGSLFQLRSAMFSLKAAGGIFGRLKPQGNEISAELIAASDAAFRFKNVLTEVGGKFFLKGTKKEIRDLNRLMRLEMQGASPEKIAALEKKLKLKKDVDMSGVSMATVQAKQAAGFDNFMGYAKQLFEDPAIPAAIMTYTTAVEKLGQEIAAALKVIGEAFGFDPSTIVAPPKPAPTSGATATSTGLPRKGKKGGSGGTPPSSGGTPPSGGTPSGGTPSGGTSPGGSGATAVTPSTPPAEPAPTAVKLDRDIVAEPDPVVEQALTAYEQALADLKGATKKQLIELAKQLGIEKISGLSLKSNLLKIGQLKDAIAKAQTAVKEKVEEAVEGNLKDAKEQAKSINTNAPPGKGKKSKKVEEASDAVTDVVAEAQAEKDAVVVTEQGEEDATATKKKTGKKATKASKKVEESSDKGAEIIAEAQAEVDVDAVEEQVKVDATAVKESTTKPTRKGTRKLKDAVTKVVEAAEDAVEDAAKGFASPKDIYEFFNPPGSQSERHRRAVEEREREERERARYTVGELPRNARSLDEELGSTESDARKKPKRGRIPESNFIRRDLARKLSTVKQLVQNALNAEQIQYELDMQIRSIKDIVEAAGIVVKETKTKGPRYEITKEAFLNLAKVLGIQLPPAFEKMGELVGRNGKALQTYQDGLENLIYSLTSTIDLSLNEADPELQMVLKQFPELVNTMILEFEYNLLRAFSTGNAGLFNFNLPFSGKESGDSLSGLFRKALEPVVRVSQKATAEQRAEASKRTASEEVLEEDRLTKEREAEIRREKAAKARAERAADVDRKKREQQADQRRKEESRLAPGQTIEDKIIQDEQTRRVVSQGQRKPRSYGVLFNLKDEIKKGIKSRDEVIQDFIRAFREKIGQARELGLSPEKLQQKIDEIVKQAKEAAKGVKLDKDALKIPEAVPVKPKRATGTGNFAKPTKVKIVSAAVEKPDLPEIVENAQKQYIDAWKALRDIEGAVSALRMLTPEYQKREPRFSQTMLNILKKDGEKYGFEVQDTIEEVDRNREQILLEINKRIEQARIDVETAKLNLQKAHESVENKGGGGAGTTTMGGPSMGMLDPFGMPIGPRGPRGPKAPRIGPMSIAFIDKGDIPGGVDSVYSLIRQRLNIPVEVMQEVINQLRNGYTNAEGEVRKAQAKIDGIGIKLSTEIGAGLDELVVILAQAIGGATDSVEIIRQAIVDKRNEFYALATKAAKESEKADRKQLGFGISRDERLKLAEQVANKIREEKSAFDNFLEYQADTLRYIARQFGFTGSGTVAEMRNFLLGRFSSDELGYTILGATEESINAAIEASKEATEKVKKKAETSKKKAEKKVAEEVVEEKPVVPGVSLTKPQVSGRVLAIRQAESGDRRSDESIILVAEQIAKEISAINSYSIEWAASLLDNIKLFAQSIESARLQDALKAIDPRFELEYLIKYVEEKLKEKLELRIKSWHEGTKAEVAASIDPVAETSAKPKSVRLPRGYTKAYMEQLMATVKPAFDATVEDFALMTKEELLSNLGVFKAIERDTKAFNYILEKYGIDIRELINKTVGEVRSRRVVAPAPVAPVTPTAPVTPASATAPSATVPAASNFKIIIDMVNSGIISLKDAFVKLYNIGMIPLKASGRALATSLNMISKASMATGGALYQLVQKGLIPHKFALNTLLPPLLSVAIAVNKAAFRLIPFGGLILNVGGKIGNAALFVSKSLKEAGEAAKGSGSFRSYIRTFFSELTKGKGTLPGITKGFSSLFDKLKSGLSNIKSGAGSFNVKNMLTSNIGMSAGMLGTGPLGMFGGNVLQSVIQGLSAIPVIGTPVVLALTAITGSIMVLAKTQDTWGKKSKTTSENFKKAFGEIKAAGLALLQPLEDMFGVLIGNSDKSNNATDQAKTKFQQFSEKVLTVSQKIRSFVENVLAPAFRILLAAIIVVLRRTAPVISSFFGVLNALYNQYTGTVEKQSKKISQAFSKGFTPGSSASFRFFEENKKNIESVGEAFAKFSSKIGSLLGALAIFLNGFIGNLTLEVFKTINVLFVNAFEQILIGTNNLLSISIRLLLKGISNLVITGIQLLASGVAKGLRTLLAPLTNLPYVGGKIEKTLNGLVSGIDRFGETARSSTSGWIDDLINPSFNTLNRSIGSISNLVSAGFDKMKDVNRKKFTKSAMDLIKGVLPEGAGSGLFKSFSNLLKQAFQDPSAAQAAGQAIKDMMKAQADAVKDINSKFFDKAVSQLEKAMGKMTSQLTSYLNKQKDDALKAFDDQIAGIEALAEAEERLTATEEYESNRRQRIKDRELQRTNYQKERALAIYEGRIDDARNLDLEELKNFEDYSKEISDMDKARQKDLQSQNRQDAITVIRNQKDAASKLFDEAIKEFEDYIEEQLRNGTTSEEEFRAQFERIAAKAQLTSTQMNTTFSTFFTNLPSQIQSGMNPVTSSAGFFSTGMDTLVNIAKSKFGIDTQTGNASGSILGVTQAMLSGSNGMSSIISRAFATDGVITTAYGSGIDSLNTYIANKLTGTGDTSLSGLFKEAMAKANVDFLAEIEKSKTGAGSKIEGLAKYLNEKFKAIALKDIMKDAIAQAQSEIEKATNAGSGSGAVTQKQFTGAAKGSAGLSNLGKFWGTESKDLGAFWYKTGTGKWTVATPTWLQTNWGKIADGTYKFAATAGAPPTFFKGGRMSYGMGGPTVGPEQQGIPATLHGGEYVIRKKAVDKYGWGMMDRINTGTYQPKQYFKGGKISDTGYIPDIPFIPGITKPKSNAYADLFGAENKEDYFSTLVSRKYNLAEFLIKKGIKQKPYYKVEKDNLYDDEPNSFTLKTYVQGIKKELSYWTFDDLGGYWSDSINFLNNKKLANYVIKMHQLAYDKAYSIASFANKYLINKNIPISKIPKSPVDSYSTWNINWDRPSGNNEVSDISNAVSILGNNGQFKKLNVGFLYNNYERNTRSGKKNLLSDIKRWNKEYGTSSQGLVFLKTFKESLKNFSLLTGMPYSFKEGYQDISSEMLRKRKELQLNVVPFSDYFGNSAFLADASGFKDRKAQIRYTPSLSGYSYDKNEIAGMFKHELGHIIGMGHPHEDNVFANDIASRMSYRIDSDAGYLPGDIAYIQRLRKAIGYKTPVQYDSSRIGGYKLGGLVKGKNKAKSSGSTSPVIPGVPEGYNSWEEYFKANSVNAPSTSFFTDKKAGSKLNAWNDPTWSYKDFNVNNSGMSDLLRVLGQGVIDAGDFFIKEPVKSFWDTLSLKNQKTIVSPKATWKEKTAAGIEDLFNIMALFSFGTSSKFGNIASGSLRRGAGVESATLIDDGINLASSKNLFGSIGSKFAGSENSLKTFFDDFKSKIVPSKIESKALDDLITKLSRMRAETANMTQNAVLEHYAKQTGLSVEKLNDVTSFASKSEYDNHWKNIIGMQNRMHHSFMNSDEYFAMTKEIKNAYKLRKLFNFRTGFFKFIKNSIKLALLNEAIGLKQNASIQNVKDMAWQGGLDKVLGKEGRYGWNAYPSISEYSSEDLESNLEGVFDTQKITYTDKSGNTITTIEKEKTPYYDDKGDLYTKVYKEYFLNTVRDKKGNIIKSGKTETFSVPELFRMHDNKLLAFNEFPKKYEFLQDAFKRAVGTFSKTVGLKPKFFYSKEHHFEDDKQALIHQLKIANNEKGLHLRTTPDPYNMEGAAMYAGDFRFPMSRQEYKKNRIRPTMMGAIGVVGKGSFDKIQKLYEIQKASPFKIGNITSLISDVLTKPFNLIGPGNTGKLRDISLLSQLPTPLLNWPFDISKYFEGVFIHELGHVLFLDHTHREDSITEGAAAGQENEKGANTAIRSVMSYNAPRPYKYQTGDIRGFQAMLKPLPKDKIKKIIKKNTKFNGGIIPYEQGGPTFGPENQGIPAILHGGEYVIRKSAVDKYGKSMLQNINQGIYKRAGQYKVGGYVDGINVPSIPKISTPMAQYSKISGLGSAPQMSSSETTHNYNFFVDNFIGETEWFNSMMKEYNMKVVPANQKQAGLESRVIRTYNGLNRGM